MVTAGSVNKLLPVPGVAHYAHGFRSIAEALYLRDHLLEQIELADAAEEGAERDARCTFVVVGAGYTGTEVAAHGQLLTRLVARRRPGLREQRSAGCCSTSPRACCPSCLPGCRLPRTGR